MNNKILLTLHLVGGLIFSASSSSALYEKKGLLAGNDKLKVTADFRFRVETDWNSQKANGVERDNRSRLRIRARMGMDYSFLDHFNLGFRVRTAATDSQQSPHVTVHDFNGNNKGQGGVGFDKWYLKAKYENAWGWVGRNSYPFWKQNELFWDDDVTLAGGTFGYSFSLGNHHKFKLIAGGFALPSGKWNFSGAMGAGQLIYNTNFTDDLSLTLATGIYGIFSDDLSSSTDRLLKGNGTRDYTLFQVNGQLKTHVYNIPLKFGVDYSHNIESYSATSVDSYEARYHDQVDGFVLSAILGDLKGQWGWQIGYYYAYLEGLSVNSSYAQDDWVRWGSATQTRGSDMKGHEFRAGLSPLKNLNMVVRVYLAESVDTNEDGNRVRLDFNYKF